MRRAFLLLLVFVGLAAATSAPASPSTAVVNPDWLRKPSADELTRYYPAEAMKRNLGGRAKIQCRLADDGVLTDCKVLSETPPGLGFGDAALQLSSRFQMRPGTRDGRPIGGSIIIPINFALPASAPPLPSPAPAAIWRVLGLNLVQLLIFCLLVGRVIWMVFLRRSPDRPRAASGDASHTTFTALSPPPHDEAPPPSALFTTDIISGGGARRPRRRAGGPVLGIGLRIGLGLALACGLFGLMVLLEANLIAPARDGLRQAYRPRAVTLTSFKLEDHGAACGSYLEQGDPKPWRFVRGDDGLWAEGRSAEWRDPAAHPDASARLEQRWRACAAYRPVSAAWEQVSKPVVLWIENRT